MCGLFTKNKISQYQDNDIEILSKRLGLLNITNEALERIKEYIDEILVTPIPTQESNRHAGVLKNIISNPE